MTMQMMPNGGVQNHRDSYNDPWHPDVHGAKPAKPRIKMRSSKFLIAALKRNLQMKKRSFLPGIKRSINMLR